LQLLLLSDYLLGVEVFQELTLVVLAVHHLDVGRKAVAAHGLHLQV
jgi:hypothetical protein